MVKALPPAYQPLRVLALPGFVLVSDAAYRLIARYRHQISEAFGLDYCVAFAREFQPAMKGGVLSSGSTSDHSSW